MLNYFKYSRMISFLLFRCLSEKIRLVVNRCLIVCTCAHIDVETVIRHVKSREINKIM